MADPAGIGMPAVGLGCWKAEKGVTEEVVYNAIKVGYRHIDSAADYGNEKEVGAGIRRAIQEGLCTRGDLWVTSKLWNTYHRREHVPLACQRTLDDLGLDYLDLYLIHFPISLAFVPFDQCYPPEWTDKPGNAGHMILDPVPYRETWEAMQTLQESGKAKHIGVSNLTAQSLMDVLSYCKIKPAVNQIESHVYLQQPGLVAFCKAHNIGVTAFSPLGAKSYVGIGLATAEEDCFLEPALKSIADTHGKTVGQVVLRFQVQRGCSVVPKSQSIDRMKENLDVFGFELSAEEMRAIEGLERNRRFNDPGVFARGWGAPGSTIALVGHPIYA
ncbi:XYL1 [Symbiodinium pilosum]|uniref:XYL1 protein n=1 Tax=Symbiodinium pilosum TaxID=2952 RepID=A0A812VKU6_SYMPI|nr:XYL1 [Symbiodinium pilosum]